MKMKYLYLEYFSFLKWDNLTNEKINKLCETAIFQFQLAIFYFKNLFIKSYVTNFFLKLIKKLNKKKNFINFNKINRIVFCFS